MSEYVLRKKTKRKKNNTLFFNKRHTKQKSFRQILFNWDTKICAITDTLARCMYSVESLKMICAMISHHTHTHTQLITS